MSKGNQFPDLFILCDDHPSVYERWKGHEIVRLSYQYPKPHTMLAVIIEEKEIKTWQEKVNGGH
jgi:hypothetical protein